MVVEAVTNVKENLTSLTRPWSEPDYIRDSRFEIQGLGGDELSENLIRQAPHFRPSLSLHQLKASYDNTLLSSLELQANPRYD